MEYKSNRTAQITEDEDGLLIDKAENGSKIFSQNFFGTKLYFDSRYEPEEEAASFIRYFYCSDRDVIVFIGLGFGYQVKELLKKMRKKQILIIVEPDERIYKAACKHVDLSEIFQDNRVRFHMYKEERLYREFLEEILDPAFFSFTDKSILTLITPQYTQVYKNIADQVRKTTQYCLKHLQSIRNTVISFSGLWLDNYIKNSRYFDTSIDMEECCGSFADMPAYLISAGPSLEKNIVELKRVQGRGIIFASYTALKVLLEHGIRPDFIVVLDGRQLDYESEEQRQTKLTIPLIYTPFADARLLQKHQGSKIKYAVSYDAYSQSINKRLGKSGKTLYAAGTVAATMMDAAYQMGCRPVIFVGQDLAFTDGLAHVPGTNYENGSSGENQNKAVGRFLLIEDVFGNQVNTNEVFLQYKQGMEDYILNQNENCRFIDATEGGARIEGTEIEKLADVVNDYQFPVHFQIEEWYREIFSGQKQNLKSYQAFVMSDMTRSFSELEKLAGELRVTCGKIEDFLKNGNNACENEAEAELLLKEIARVNDRIDGFYETNKLFQLSLLGNILSAERQGGNLEGKEENEWEYLFRQPVRLYRNIIELYRTKKAVFKSLTT